MCCPILRLVLGSRVKPLLQDFFLSSAKDGVLVPRPWKFRLADDWRMRIRDLLGKKERKQGTGTFHKARVSAGVLPTSQLVSQFPHRKRRDQAPPGCKWGEVPKSPPQCLGWLEFCQGVPSTRLSHTTHCLLALCLLDRSQCLKHSEHTMSNQNCEKYQHLSSSHYKF